MPEPAVPPSGPHALVAELCGWGGGPRVPAVLVRPSDEAGLRTAIRPGMGGAIARGMGRAYGDAAQLRGGTVLDVTGLHEYALDAQSGVLTAQAGVTIGELLRVLVPQGWILPALPGTQHVTVGGMLASDVHGKDHASAGSVASHVVSLGLLDSSGELRTLAPEDDDGWFAATVGGMGLTGVIVWAQIRLLRLSGPMMSVDTDRAASLEQVLELLQAPGGPHRVAWLDLLGGAGRTRGVVTRAAYTTRAAETRRTQESHNRGGRADVEVRATVPPWLPGGLPRLGVKAFNALRFRTSSVASRNQLEPIGLHMFPLDRLADWPRLYGRKGLVQYQFAIPPERAEVIERVIDTLHAQRVPSFLAVLKNLGPGYDAPLSFPIAGWTLALDLPRSASGLEAALGRCDNLVAEAGGRVYLTKDSRLRSELLPAMYPRLDEWRERRAELDPDGVWRSDLGIRLGLVEASSRRMGIAVPASNAIGRSAVQSPARARNATRAPRRVLLVGGSSDIGVAILQRMAQDGPVRAHLLGRNLFAMRSALTQAGIDGECGELDLEQFDGVEPAIIAGCAALGEVDVIVLAAGTLGAQAGLDADPVEAVDVLRLNTVGCGAALLAALRALRTQGRGSLVVLSSVAAERPRAGNAIYGAAKAALDALAQGLSDALASSGVEVIVVRPGFVTTKMTAGLKPAPLATSATAVAEATVAALGHGSRTVWVPWTLRPLFSVLRHLPRGLYRRLPL